MTDIMKEIPKTRKDLLEFLMAEEDDAKNLRDKINSDLGEKRIDIIREKRVFFQNIAITSATLLGLTTAFSSINPVAISRYLHVGLGFLLWVICMVVMYIRDILDRDSEGLVSSQDRYISVLQDKMKVIERYVDICLQEGDDSVVESSLPAYFEELKSPSSAQEIIKQNKQINQERELRVEGKAEMEFYGEFITFFFILGVFFVLIAIIGKRWELPYLIVAVLGIFLFIFTEFLSRLWKHVFKILTFLRRDIGKVNKGK